MRIDTLKKAVLIPLGLAACSLLLAAGSAHAAQSVNLTAAPATATLPDGSSVPMWGYSCGAAVGGSTASCAALNSAVTAGGWSPVVITVPSGQDLSITLTNNLSFANGNTVPTSLVIVGQLGGGLGGTPSRTTSPAHAAQGVTWSTVGSPGSGPTFTPPPQSDRVQSFATEVSAGSAATLTWTAPRPGTYLIESGTHPSIQGPMGLYGILVVTQAPTASAGLETASGVAYPGVSYDAEVPLLLSEIDPVQNAAVSAAVNTAGFSETMVWSGQPGGCGNPASATYQQCYPPAVNYSPLYFLFNGVAFDRTHAAASLFPVTPAPASASGSVLVRLVNAGLRMHVPTLVGTTTGSAKAGGFALVAEDGNPVPGLPRIQNEVFMAAGKTFDAVINLPATATAIPVYDRQLSLSGNAIDRDAGMLAYVSVNPGSAALAALPAAPTLGAATARADTYNALVPCSANPCAPVVISDPSKGVIANDTNVYGVQQMTAPTNGSLTLNANGTFTYVPNAGAVTADSFTYCANGTVNNAVSPATCSSSITATVSLNMATLESNTAVIAASNAFSSNVAGYLAIKPPGILAGATDAAGHPVTVAPGSVSALTGSAGTGTLTVNPNGSFIATVGAPGTYTFTYQAQNSQGTVSKNSGTVTLTFPAPSNLSVNVIDGQTNTALPQSGFNGNQDYRWVIEEDETFYVDPTKTTNTGTSGQTSTAVLGVNFHTSHMPFVAQGCTGPKSCEQGQTVYDANPASPTFGTHVAAVCDLGNGACRPDPTGAGQTPIYPAQVALDPTKRYYISILPGDAADPFYNASGTGTNVGHGMGGAPIGFGQTGVTIVSQPSPYPPGKLSVFVFEDDYPLNGELDSGGGVDILAPNEPGLGDFQIHLWDAMGGNGDFTGQMTYDMFNQPLTNGLAGTIDPATGQNACPVSPSSTVAFTTANVTASGSGPGNTITVAGLTVSTSQVGSTLVITGGTGFAPGTYTVASVDVLNRLWTLTPAIPGANAVTAATASGMTGTMTQPGITGMIVTCPKYEADGVTLSPLAGQAVVNNLMPGRWGVVATPGADRIARGEEWLQTNTLDGQKAHDSFTRIGEPSYFQEFGPAGYHVTVGFANPKIINDRLAGVCAGTDVNLQVNIGSATGCNNTLIGRITGERLSRTPDERLYNTDDRSAFIWTQCYVSVGDPDGEDFAFAKCDAQGNFKLTGLPPGSWRVTTFDQWNDQLVDGLSTPVALGSSTKCPGSASSVANHVCDMGNIAATQWQTNLQTKTFMDDAKSGVATDKSDGIPFANVAVRLRDGSLENLLVTDFTGTANFNETFPLFSWYTVETDVTRYKNTGIHAVYDAGGPADGSSACGVAGYPPCGTSTIAHQLANTAEQVSLPTSLRVPGAIYCAGADCSGKSMAAGSASDPPSSCKTTTNAQGAAVTTCSPQLSTGRIDPPWVGVEGWQGFPGQFNWLEFGKAPYASGENGGIKGHVIYASTRPFDDPQMLVQTQWEPLVPHVTINLYQEGTAADGTQTLTLVDHTQTSSWDDWAQGFRSDGAPNMNCPGQSTADLFYFTLYNQPNYLNTYAAAHGGAAAPALPDNSQFKCYDGMHNWNQLQPAPYDGMYQFPSVTGLDPATGKPTGTNCTICIADPDSSDPYRFGTKMLPKGKYVVEVVVPPGFELVKEEDKNILIGDNFIAPVSQQFGGLGGVFIMPDQASVASAYNANNAQNATNSLGASPNNGIVPGFIPEPTWPCVGQARVVPDYISLYPESQQVAPFAGATRNLCDRKEVTLADQMGAIAKFYVYTSTHIASKFYGGITDDFTSEFDPFSPQFGEKFAPPDLPVAVRDWSGTEINRVYADSWGAYNGMTYSTWEVNPPNPTGYSPSMMVMCMNDAGPLLDPATRTPLLNTNGVPMTDPLFNQGYSQFCYELPFMPGTTQYLDTPVVPVSAFSEGYNHADCAYPDATPAVSRVDGNGAQGGPWVSQAGQTLTITALGDQSVSNYGYTGPSATTAPYNAKTITRHYGFGSQCTSPSPGSATCNTLSGVKIGSQAATVTAWSDSSITVQVPTGVSNCAVQQQAIYGGSSAQCGQLVITAGNGRMSIDAVTVTIGGKAPTYVSSTAPLTPYGSGAIQQAIDAAQPGDLILVPPGTYAEMLIMWKPVRLQGFGAPVSIIDANTHPAGKLDPWRAQVACLFGLATNGQPFTPGGNIPSPTNGNPFDPTNAFSCGNTAGTPWTGFNAVLNNPQVDRLPLEGILGWDTTVNGNLAQLLQEPTLLGAYEGSGILVLSKGVNVPANATTSYYGSGSEASFPTGTALLTGSDCLTPDGSANPYPSNFQCNPSTIDGLTVTNSSQGGGGIFVHAWGHNLQIANNRVFGNIGTLSGGINIGQGESPDAYLAGTASDSDPGSCREVLTDPANLQLPYCFDLNVNVHHNAVTQNTSIGDELFSGTPSGAGGVTFCTGADYYQFNYNWLCGNMSTGDGGGFAHLGYIWYGDVEHNTILFNQSLNPTIATNGGGIVVMGAAPDGLTAAGVECGNSAADADCTPGLPDGTGPGLRINANLIMGNAAESGSGGGIRFQSVNGTELASFPNGTKSYSLAGLPPGFASAPAWNTVSVTNNIIANNVAGWDGGGISLQDALAVNLVNNTVMSNVTTASSGVLFNTLGAPVASAPGATNQTNTATTSAPQPAGLVTMNNSSNLTASLTGIVLTCPANHATSTGPSCRGFSVPYIANDIFWQNSAYYIGVGSLSAQFQQNVVALYNAFTTTQAASQPSADTTAPAPSGNGVVITGGTGACVSGTSYWDLGVRGDTKPGNHGSGLTLAPVYSILTYPSTGGNSENGNGSNNLLGSNPSVLSQYCNGSRTPPEAGPNAGWQVPPGISDATVPNPIFNLSPAATVDEGNNWINMQWGPLSLVNPVTGITLGNYAIAAGSAAIDQVPTGSAAGAAAPKTDFFNNPRPSPGTLIDIGAVEYQAPAAVAIASVTGGPLAFGNVPVTSPATDSAAQNLTLHNTGTGPLTGITVTPSAQFVRAAGAAGGTCTATLAAGATCTIGIEFAPTATGLDTGTITVTGNVTVTGSPVSVSGTGVAAVTSATLTPTTWTVSHARNCPGTTVAGIVLCALDPAQTFTLTNTGNVTLTNIGHGALGGTAANVANYALRPALSTCGAVGGTQTVGFTTLAPGATCVVTVQFQPQTGQTAGLKPASVSVTDGAGTQTATLNGTAQ